MDSIRTIRFHDMAPFLCGLFVVVAVAASFAAQPEPVDDYQCTPTPPDMLGPFYKSGAPERPSVGSGYVLTGVVKSAADCDPQAGTPVEFWLAGPDGDYADAYRATVTTDEKGNYRFESDVPPPYWGRPPHIHIRVAAKGFKTLVTQHYPDSGAREAVFDLVLVPGTDRSP